MLSRLSPSSSSLAFFFPLSVTLSLARSSSALSPIYIHSSFHVSFHLFSSLAVLFCLLLFSKKRTYPSSHGSVCMSIYTFAHLFLLCFTHAREMDGQTHRFGGAGTSMYAMYLLHAHMHLEPFSSFVSGILSLCLSISNLYISTSLYS